MDSGRPLGMRVGGGERPIWPNWGPRAESSLQRGNHEVRRTRSVLPNLTRFPSPRGLPGSTVQRFSSAWLNDRAPEGSSPSGARRRNGSGDRDGLPPRSAAATVTVRRPRSASPAAAAAPARRAAAAAGGPAAAGRAATTAAARPPATAARGGPAAGTRPGRGVLDAGQPRQDHHQTDKDAHTDQHRDENGHAAHPPFPRSAVPPSLPSRFSLFPLFLCVLCVSLRAVAMRTCPCDAYVPLRCVRAREIPTLRAPQSRLEQLQSLGAG